MKDLALRTPNNLYEHPDVSSNYTDLPWEHDDGSNNSNIWKLCKHDLIDNKYSKEKLSVSNDLHNYMLLFFVRK